MAGTLVIASGAAVALAAMAVITALPIGALERGLLAGAWCAMAALSLRRQARARRGWLGVHLFPDGTVELRGNGGVTCGRLAAGSVVLARIAWLRVRVPGAPPGQQLIRASVQDREQWRRFQVICRHLTS